jgi:VanZ family protein
VKAYWRVAAGLIALAAVVLAENMFGRQLNALFLAHPGLDKILHTVEYLLVFVYVYWVAGSVAPERTRRALIAGSVGVLLSVADELVQQLAPGRSVELFDLAADGAGLTLGWVATVRPTRAVALTATTLALATGLYVAADTRARLFDYSLALRYERNHEFARARTHYLRAIDAGLRGAEIYNGLAWVSVESGVGNPHDSVAYARMALDARPFDADVIDTYGWALLHAGQASEALVYLQQAYAQKPDMYCIHYHLGAAYLAVGQRELAQFHFLRQRERTDAREAALAIKALDAMGAKSDGATATGVSTTGNGGVTK